MSTPSLSFSLRSLCFGAVPVSVTLTVTLALT